MIRRGDEIFVYPSGYRAAFLGCASVVFVAGSMAMIVLGVASGILWLIVIGAIGLIFFSLAGSYIFRRAMSGEPLLVIDDTGIIESASFLAVGRIRWEEIASFTPRNYRGQAMVGIWLKDRSSVYRRLSWYKRALLSLNSLLGTPPVNIGQAMLPLSVEELALELERRRRQAEASAQDASC